MDRGTWQAIVHRVAQSQIRLKRLSTHTHVCVCVCVCVCIPTEVSKRSKNYSCKRNWIGAHIKYLELFAGGSNIILN